MPCWNIDNENNRKERRVLFLQALLIFGGNIPSFAMHVTGVSEILLWWGFRPITLILTLKHVKQVESTATNCTVVPATVAGAFQNQSEHWLPLISLENGWGSHGKQIKSKLQLFLQVCSSASFLPKPLCCILKFRETFCFKLLFVYTYEYFLGFWPVQ